MPGMNDLMDELPETLGGSATATANNDNPDDDEIEEPETPQTPDPDKGDEDDNPDDNPDPDNPDLEDDEEEYELDDEEDDDDKPKPATTTPPAPEINDEGKFILDNLQKIHTRVIVPGADGKDEVKDVDVYGWGDLPKDMKGFATAYEQGVFSGAASSQELKAQQLQTQFRQNKMQADAEAYTIRENRGIARDLKTLRSEGIFPKFKGIPGSSDFNNSDGAKMFDEVVAFMNEENEKAGQAAQKGEAFYHISFRQAYRMLHPEAFDTKGKEQQRNSQREAARRVKTRPGQSPDHKANVQTKRVSNITDLAGEFENFAGSGK